MTEHRPAVPQDAARWMDAARSVLAVTVAFSHAWLLFVADHRPGDPFISYPFFFASGLAHTAVILFFVLSGFGIAKSVEALDRRGWQWRAFLTDRWTRLGIVVFPALLLGGMLDAIGYFLLGTPAHLNVTQAWFLPADMGSALSLETLIGNLVFVQNILVKPLGSNGPLWSVAFEFWFYIWFAALWVAVRHRRFEPALAALALGFVSHDLAIGFAAWLAGAAAWFWRDRLVHARFGLIGIVLAGVLLWARLGDRPGEDLVVAISAAAFVTALLRRNPHFPSWLAPVARFGACGSFSLYAIHFPIMALIAGLTVWPQQLRPDGVGIAAALAAVAGSIAVAVIFARLTEANTARLRAWLGGRDKVAYPAE
jgi:peptidoglycan/LPS O-acetylase OafA/YrhL